MVGYCNEKFKLAATLELWTLQTKVLFFGSHPEACLQIRGNMAANCTFELWPLQPKSSLLQPCLKNGITTPEGGQWWLKAREDLPYPISITVKFQCYLTWLWPKIAFMHESESSFFVYKTRLQVWGVDAYLSTIHAILHIYKNMSINGLRYFLLIGIYLIKILPPD